MFTPATGGDPGRRHRRSSARGDIVVQRTNTNKLGQSEVLLPIRTSHL